MSFTGPTQTPVTGSEYQDNQSETLQALAQLYRALNSRDIKLMQENWDDSAEAAMASPLGGIKRGWTEIRTLYEQLFATNGEYYFEFHDYCLHESADLFYVVGRECGELNANGRRMRLAIRTTRVFRRDRSRTWRQVHHHRSIDDPQMLAAYQGAVFGTPSVA
jgi:ketosteroid isomerase-like protein